MKAHSARSCPRDFCLGPRKHHLFLSLINRTTEVESVQRGTYHTLTYIVWWCTLKNLKICLLSKLCAPTRDQSRTVSNISRSPTHRLYHLLLWFIELVTSPWLRKRNLKRIIGHVQLLRTGDCHSIPRLQLFVSFNRPQGDTVNVERHEENIKDCLGILAFNSESSHYNF